MIRNIILGSEGFVGKPLCDFLESLGEEVIKYDIKRDENEDLRTAKIDLDDIDRVYFLAWDVGGAKYLYKQESQFRQLDWNLRLLINTMPQLQVSKKNFLFASSQLAEEYDTVYGSTKRLGEVWTHLLKGCRVRFWNVYGPLEEPTERTHVISDFVYQAVTTGKIEMMTTGEEVRQFIHIDDLCRAVYYVISNNLNKNVYDITSFEWISIMDIAEIIASLTGAKIYPGKIIGSTPITPLRGKVPNWFPQVDIQSGIKTMVEELKEKIKRGI